MDHTDTPGHCGHVDIHHPMHLALPCVGGSKMGLLRCSQT